VSCIVASRLRLFDLPLRCMVQEVEDCMGSRPNPQQYGREIFTLTSFAQSREDPINVCVEDELLMRYGCACGIPLLEALRHSAVVRYGLRRSHCYCRRTPSVALMGPCKQGYRLGSSQASDNGYSDLLQMSMISTPDPGGISWTVPNLSQDQSLASCALVGRP
jgi:hypothetical protein